MEGENYKGGFNIARSGKDKGRILVGIKGLTAREAGKKRAHIFAGLPGWAEGALRGFLLVFGDLPPNGVSQQHLAEKTAKDLEDEPLERRFQGLGNGAGHGLDPQAAPAFRQDEMHLKAALAGALHEMAAGEAGLGNRFRHTYILLYT